MDYGAGELTSNNKRSCQTELIPDFLLFQCCSPLFVEQCVSLTRGAHYPAVNQSQLSEIKIVVPDKVLQRQIVDFFETFYLKINRIKDFQSKFRKSLVMLPEAIIREELAS